MSFEQHITKIENSDFQIQFAALSGYSVLKVVLESHEFPCSLMMSLSRGEVEIQEVYERILHQLSRAEADLTMCYDGSTVTYLYALSQIDPDTAREASRQIMKARGLFWSRRLALRILEARETEAVPAVD